MRGEHGAYGDPGDERRDLCGVQPGGTDPLGGLREPAALADPLGPHLPGPVHLLGDVGQVEVGAEGPHQPGGRLHVDVLQQRGQVAVTAAVAAAEPAHLLDQVEQLLALLAHQRLAQQVAQPAYVGAQRHLRAVVDRRVARLHPSTIGPQSRAETPPTGIRDRPQPDVGWKNPPAASRSGAAVLRQPPPGVLS